MTQVFCRPAHKRTYMARTLAYWVRAMLYERDVSMTNVYFNHDGGVDDLVSLLLLLQMPEARVTGVSVIDADGQMEAALEATRKIIDLFGGKQGVFEVVASTSRPHHQFPSEWRGAAFTFDALPILNEHGAPKTPVTDVPAHLDLVNKVMAQEGKTTLLFTGPLTDLARALDAEPAIEDKIEALYWMGGSLDGHGNVVDPCFDGTAEWNAFWDPEAVKRVWDSSLEIHMVGLESTEELPLTRELCQHWATLRRYPAIDLIGQGYALVLNVAANNVYYLWDVLTTVYCLYADIAEVERVRCDVRVDGAAAGRTYRCDEGREVTLVTYTDAERFYALVDELAMSAAPALY